VPHVLWLRDFHQVSATATRSRMTRSLGCNGRAASSMPFLLQRSRNARTSDAAVALSTEPQRCYCGLRGAALFSTLSGCHRGHGACSGLGRVAVNPIGRHHRGRCDTSLNAMTPPPRTRHGCAAGRAPARPPHHRRRRSAEAAATPLYWRRADATASPSSRHCRLRHDVTAGTHPPR